MGFLLPFLILLLLVRLSPKAAGRSLRPLFRPITAEMDTPARAQQWASRISLSMLLVPTLVSAAFILMFIVGSATLPPWFLAMLPLAAKLWIATGIMGMLFGIVASHLAKWSGDELTLIVIHLMSVLFVWIVPNIVYLGHPD